MSTTIALDDMLRASVVLGRYARNRVQFCTMAEMLGIAPNRLVTTDNDGVKDVSLVTSNSQDLPARAGTYDIYDRPTDGADVVPPGQPAQIIAHNPVGNVNYRVARIHPSIILEWDKLNVRRAIGSNAGVIDSMGQVYAEAQLETLGLKLYNSLEIMTIGMMRDSLYLIPSGVPNSFKFDVVSTNSIAQINFQMPSGNKTQLNMLGAGNIIGTTWLNTTSATIISDCNKVSAAFVQLTGRPLRTVVVNSIGWNNVANNTEVRNMAGSANSPVANFDYTSEIMPDGEKRAVRKAVLKGLPGIEWVINDETLTINGSTVKKIEDTAAWFGTDTTGVFKLGNYAEPISEQPGQLPTKKSGIAFWKEYKSNPSGAQCFALGNFIPMNLIPKCSAYGTVVF